MTSQQEKRLQKRVKKRTPAKPEEKEVAEQDEDAGETDGPLLTNFLDNDVVNRGFFRRAMEDSRKPGHSPRFIVDEIKDGKKTGRVALSRMQM
jgi:hypothetical protein